MAIVDYFRDLGVKAEFVAGTPAMADVYELIKVRVSSIMVRWVVDQCDRKSVERKEQ
jgi:hypothetical protein